MPAPNPVNLAAEIVAAYTSNNSVPKAELPALIEGLCAALKRLVGEEDLPPIAAKSALPAVSIQNSITPDYLICLEDGLKFKTLKRHLVMLGMTPAQYRAKWNLPPDYPMVAPRYASQRSKLARENGLGRKGSNKAGTSASTTPGARVRSRKMAGK